MSNKKEEKTSIVQKAVKKRPAMHLPAGLGKAIADRVAIRYEMPKRDYDYCKQALSEIYGRPVDDPHAVNFIYFFGLYTLAIESGMDKNQLAKWGQATLTMPNYDEKNKIFSTSILSASQKIIGEVRLTKLYDITSTKLRHISNDTFIAYLGMVFIRKIVDGRVSAPNIDDELMAILNGDLEPKILPLGPNDKPNIEIVK